MLRHDKHIRANRLGFAWVDDVLVQLEKRGIQCSLSDIDFVVAREQGVRSQVASLNDRPLGYFDTIIRCAQGHSGKVQAHMDSPLAHRPALHAQAWTTSARVPRDTLHEFEEFRGEQRQRSRLTPKGGELKADGISTAQRSFLREAVRQRDSARRGSMSSSP